MVKIDNIPVYDAIIADDECGMMRISLVDAPAVMSDFVAFNAQEPRRQMYAIEDEAERRVLGVVMRADFPIYRRDKKMGEYYIIYKSDVIKQMAEKYLLESRQNDVNLDHDDDKVVDGVQMVQYFIKDTAKGIIPAGFDDIADGSLFAEFHVVNDDVWEEIKAGTYKGFSLEGLFVLTPEEDVEGVQDIVDKLQGQFERIFSKSKNSMSKIKQIFNAVFSALVKVQCSETSTDKGVLYWDGDADLKAGDAVFLMDEEGNRTDAPDGDYTTEDGKIIRVADGKVTEIVDNDAEVAGGRVGTDNGELVWDGDGDLAEGMEVFVEDEDGNRTPAPDGDYRTEDGKTIKVVDGKVSEIVDPDAEVSDENEADVKAARKQHFARVKAVFAESYNERINKISQAIYDAGLYDDFYIIDAGDDFALISAWSWDDESYEDVHYYQIPLTWNGDEVSLGEPFEVKQIWVPVDDPQPVAETDGPTEDEMAELQHRVQDLIAENERLRKQPLGQPAHEAFEQVSEISKTGNRKMDSLYERLTATYKPLAK